MRSPSGDIVVFYTGTEPRMSREQALALADQLRELATEPPATGLAGALRGWPDEAGRMGAG
ncbi:hypothetical protein ACFXJ8_38140 [Nonomuraea sp. NPDC059194]|uniref:hypothetical protein n=1 Tax=Nonomuraea sp. NPDC059194 TaxID=3346764 RepID=UPI00368A63F2